jgi:hypothetical protein
MTAPLSAGWLSQLGAMTEQATGKLARSILSIVRPPGRSTSAVIRIFIVLYHFGIALHLDNTFSENDYRQLSCLA